MARPKKKLSNTISALIQDLPAHGTDWSADKQKQWLEIFRRAMVVSYGGSVDDLPASAPAPAPVAATPPAPRPKFKKPQVYPFYIDHEGYARRKDGERINPTDVTGELVDLRGIDGDAAAIVWASGATGLNGSDVLITMPQ